MVSRMSAMDRTYQWCRRLWSPGWDSIKYVITDHPISSDRPRRWWAVPALPPPCSELPSSPYPPSPPKPLWLSPSVLSFKRLTFPSLMSATPSLPYSCHPIPLFSSPASSIGLLMYLAVLVQTLWGWRFCFLHYMSSPDNSAWPGVGAQEMLDGLMICRRKGPST